MKPDAGADSPHHVIAETTHDGFRGCCRYGAGSLGLQVQCDDHNTGAEGFIWVDAGDKNEVPACSNYSVDYDLH